MLGGDPVARNRAIQTGIKANATEEEREVQAAKDLIAAANSPVERFMQGLGRGLAPGPTTRFSWQEETPTEKMVSDLTDNTVSGAAGNMIGESLPYLMAYGKLGGAVGDAAMKLPGAAKLGKFGQGALKSVAADAVLGAPLNANYVLNKQGLRGEEALKEFAKQEALDLGLGIGTEGILYLRNGKRIKNVSDINKLTDKETIETAEKLTEKQASRYKNKAGRRLTENDIEEYISTGSNKAKYKKRKATKEGENLLLVNNDEIETFVTDAINGDIKNIEKAYGKPEARFIEDVKAATGGDVDISGYYLELNADDIKHSVRWTSYSKASRRYTVKS